jgi:hypothetical protein
MSEVTLCKNCNFHHCKTPRSKIWYDHVCTAPEAQRPPKLDCVTGEMVIEETHCRDVNKGACLHFEKCLLVDNIRPNALLRRLVQQLT